MIAASVNLKNALAQSVSITALPVCEIEHNMNSLIDGITVVSTSNDTQYRSGITDWSETKSNPFKKLFPIDSILKPMRPMYPGVKYFIMGGPTVRDTYSSDYVKNPPFLPFRTLSYTGEGKDFNVSGAKPRIYYPGVNTEYKYWLSPLNSNINLTVQYLQTSETWAAAGKTGSIPAGNKAALANKILIKFEKFHSIPTNYKVTITKSDGTTSEVGPITTTSTESGIISLTLENGTWTKRDGASALPDTLVLDNPILIKSIKLEATNPGGGKYLGVIEISARWVSYISNDIVSLEINKEASSSSEDILPVGLVTANTLSMSINRFNQELKVKNYNRDITSFDQGTIYLAKNSELRPKFKVIHTGGSIIVPGDASSNYDLVPQGTFYLDSWGISQYGEAQITALDGAKHLMETLSPDLLCEDAPVVAILRNLLDSIGFTNYKFNITSTDKSINNILYWWTEDEKTVWDEIQSLCRDIQMNASFDENNILQFYSRDYLYSTDNMTLDYTFYQDQSGSNLPNIITFNKKEIPSANSVQVKWKAPMSSNLLGSSEPLWNSGASYLSAGALKQPEGRPVTEAALKLTDEFFVIDQESLDPFGQEQGFYNFNSFVAIESEIIEYDAIGYDYTPRESITNEKISVWLESGSEYSKYLTLSKSGFENADKPETAYFRPNGKYRIKKDKLGNIVGRGALGTVASEHKISTSNLSGDSKWKGAVVSFAAREKVSKATDGNYSAYNFTTDMQVTDYLDSTTIKIEAITSAPGIKLTVQELDDKFINVGSPEVTNFIAGPAGKDLELEIGKLYRISFQPKNSSGTQRGNTQTITHRMISNKFNGSPTANPTDPTKITTVNKSFLKLNSDKLNSGEFVLAFRDFNSLKMPPSTSVSASYPVFFTGDYYQSYAGPKTIAITAASAAAGKITYTATGHKFPINDVVNIAGISIPSYNKPNAVVTNITNNTFSVSGTVEAGTPTFDGASASSGSYYYSFGTSVFLDKSSVNPEQSAGLGFFINELGARGYFVIIEALKSAATVNRKSVRIIKAQPGGIKVLKDSQITLKSTLDAIYSGLAYNIDVKVKMTGQKVDIVADINGHKITANDINSTDLGKDPNWILGPTRNVGLMALDGTAIFDYVYASTIDEDKYKASEYVTNIYQGQFSNDIISTAYGDMIYNANLAEDEKEYGLKEVIDEFGPVVREIAYINQKFAARPALPIAWSTGANKLVSVIGSKLSSFGAEAYILNNTSVKVPLSDKGINTLQVIGNSIEPSGELIYSTDDTSEYSIKEPIIFDSTWIQSEAAAKSLAKWIQDKVMNKGRVVNMSVFGNPLIAVGDIVSISNAYQGFEGTEKLIITNVSQRFDQGLETEVTCRTL